MNLSTARGESTRGRRWARALLRAHPSYSYELLDELVAAVRLDLEDVEPSVERVVRLRREAEVTAQDPVLDPHVLDGADHGAELHLALSLCARLLDRGMQDLDCTVGRRTDRAGL